MSGTEVVVETGSEVKCFIERTLKEIQEGTKSAKFQIDKTVDFDLEVTEKKEIEGRGGFKSFIRIGGKKEGESVQRVRFSVKPEVKLFVA